MLEFDHIKFSLAISPKMTMDTVNDTEMSSILLKWKKRIFDINFTSRIDPFHTDAHGIIISKNEAENHFDFMMHIQQSTGIKVSAIFNNILVPPTLDKLETFCENFDVLYNKGLRSVTLPHSIWMHLGLIQKRFPDLVVKNTVLRKARSAQDFYNFALAGFEYVNLDRILWRDIQSLKEIKNAQKAFLKSSGKYVFISILIGEGCQGNCSFFDEHYQYTMSAFDKNKACKLNNELVHVDAKLPIRISGCNNNISVFSRTSPSPFREDLKKMCQYIDVIKLAGRHDRQVLFKNIKFMDGFFSDQGDVVKSVAECFSPMVIDSMSLPFMKKWRKKIMSCKYQCWKCEECQVMQIELMKNNFFNFTRSE